ncbi:MAG: GNAT family N-acetyltransferase [Alphaproteobacteria bacterium]|nr:GNAT family N-acetyltransferase [Alphaproteobacteria bacterium]
MLKVSVLGSYAEIDATAWDALVGDDGSPFLEHVFLRTLEDFGCAVPETGWTPRPVVVRDGERLVGAAPCWVKEHSMGEFVYDHGWADAAMRAGLSYYPKLVVGVPFSPVTGQRLLIAPDADRAAVLEALLAGIEAAGRDCHGLHVLFDTEEESTELAARGAFTRLQYQFHWTNQGYERFDDWLKAFPSDKRNKLRRERKEVARLRFDVKTAPDEAELAALHRFHRNTAGQFGPWGRVYLSEEAFQHLGQVWGDRLHTVLARDGDRLVAGTFNVLKGDRLYGRYWGCDRDIKFLHFEVCYYRPIEDAIARGVKVFEPGHGGSHKVSRGFDPTITYSNHLLRDPRLHDALARHTEGEARRVRQAVQQYTEEKS